MSGERTAFDPFFEARQPAAYRAVDVARLLGLPLPTPEQQRVIEAPLAPTVVVAGAGSGKTETMAARVVWLVVNGFVQPDEVLGLTFTRKAASELDERIAGRLDLARGQGLWAPADDGFGGFVPVVTVSTYHAYAGRLVGEHALRLGVEPESRLLTEAAAWQYAAEAVAAYDGPMDAVDKAEATVVAAVISLAGQLAEQVKSVDELEAELARMAMRFEQLPTGKGAQAEAKALMAKIAERRQILPIVADFAARKRRRDAMDFADRMELAARLATEFPVVGQIERRRFRAVLLDEFQDTSEAQLTLLAALFSDPADPLAVTAVGDPNQSIYGWRGASATTLRRFPDAFAVAESGRLELSTSWRNDQAILTVANLVAAPLAPPPGLLAPVELRARPEAGRGIVAAGRFTTIVEEADHVAAWIAERRAAAPGASAAVLCRKRSQFAPVTDALERRGIPYEVFGLGGLLTTPEVCDIVALLHAVADPSRGDQLMRLLSGPTVRLGAADLDGLWSWARARQRGPRRESPGSDLAPDSTDEPSLVEAIADLPPGDWIGPEGERLGESARGRLHRLAHVVQRLRETTGIELAELVGEAERALGLDIEILARPEYSPSAARAHLDAFADVAASFAHGSDRPTLPAFLAWLEAAQAEERGLDKGYVEPVAGAVQVLTVHSAKGLEWDIVAIPGLVEGSFPDHSAVARFAAGDWIVGRPKDKGWFGELRDAGLPYALRGDRDGLPVLRWEGAETLVDVHAAVTEFIEAGGDHAVAEERRLAYVALTRARRALLLTTHIWGGASTKTPRVTSRFLTELMAHPDAGVRHGPWAAMPDPDVGPLANPLDAEPVTATWPRGPSTPRRAAIDAAAEELTAAIVAWSDSGPDVPERGPGIDGEDRLLDALLAERAARQHPESPAAVLPSHLSTSALVQLAADPAGFALSVRRPVPTAPDLVTRRGTDFHAWVEKHYARATLVDILDLPGSADDDHDGSADLAALQANFLASPWADRAPLEVESSVETVVDGIAIRGRIDAVFADDERGPGSVVVVDWKTGAPPTGAAAATRSLQLAAYALAYARLHGLDPGQVRGAFFYAATGVTVYPDLDPEAVARVLSQALSEPVADRAAV